MFTYQTGGVIGNASKLVRAENIQWSLISVSTYIYTHNVQCVYTVYMYSIYVYIYCVYICVCIYVHIRIHIYIDLNTLTYIHCILGLLFRPMY